MISFYLIAIFAYILIAFVLPVSPVISYRPETIPEQLVIRVLEYCYAKMIYIRLDHELGYIWWLSCDPLVVYKFIFSQDNVLTFFDTIFFINLILLERNINV